MLLTLDTSATLDLALLGLTRHTAEPVTALCRQVRTLVGPWLTPTDEVVTGRMERLVHRGLAEIVPHPRDDQTLRCREAGNLAFGELMRRPLCTFSVALMVAGEAVKLACLHLLDPPARRAVAAELLAACRRSRNELGRRLAEEDSASPVLARSLEHRLHLLELAEEAVRAGSSQPDGPAWAAA
jgi:hypothetical protein